MSVSPTDVHGPAQLHDFTSALHAGVSTLERLGDVHAPPDPDLPATVRFASDKRSATHAVAPLGPSGIESRRVRFRPSTDAHATHATHADPLPPGARAHVEAPGVGDLPAALLLLAALERNIYGLHEAVQEALSASDLRIILEKVTMLEEHLYRIRMDVRAQTASRTMSATAKHER